MSKGRKWDFNDYFVVGVALFFFVGLPVALVNEVVQDVRHNHAKSTCLAHGYSRVEETGFFVKDFYCQRRVDQTDQVVAVTEVK